MATQTPKFYVKNTTTANTINVYRLITGAMTFNGFVFGDVDDLRSQPLQALQFQMMPIGSGTFHVDVVANNNLTDVATLGIFLPLSTTIANNKTQYDWILFNSEQMMFNQIALVNTTTTSFTLVLGVWGVSN
jgi:hypothetical protein